jgi:4-hydroxy-tetrahydrodipicolinate synthase
MSPLNLHGIIPATVLPMTTDFEPDLAVLEHYLNWVVAQGPVALAINVDTGEGPHLSRQERIDVLKTAANVVHGRCGIIAGVGGPFTAAAVEQARDAQAAGADAIMVFPVPAFQASPLDPEIPYRYHKAIAAAVDLPLVLFQLRPVLGGIEYPPEVLGKLLEIQSVVAIKDACFDPVKFVQLRATLNQAPQKIQLLSGNDNFIGHSFLLGADGALIGFGTLATALQVQMYQAARARDFVTVFRLSSIIQPLSDVIFASPIPDYRARLKEALVMQGVLPNAYVRPPLLPIGAAEREKICQAMQAAGQLEDVHVG